MTLGPPVREDPRAPRPVARWMLLALVLFSFFLVFTGQCSLGESTSRAYPARPLPPQPEPTLLPPPPVNDEYMPCGDCHEDEPTIRTVRELDEHDDFEFKHGDLWCLDCHDGDDHQRLHLSDGTLIEFEESLRLCTRCHAEKVPDWRAGVHGKRTGYWWGPKEYRTCVECHRPHSPRFGQLEPKPPPPRSVDIRLRAGEEPEEASRGDG